MGAKVYLPVDGKTTSEEFHNLFSSLGVSKASLDVLRPLISNAVVAAQVGEGLSKHDGITQVAMDTAQTSVPAAPITERSTSL